jgi:hypothetical protein
MKSNTAILLVLTFLALGAGVGHAGDSSLPNIDSESPEESAMVAFGKLLAENRKLRAEVEEARKLAANTTAESEIFKRQVQEMMRMVQLTQAFVEKPDAESKLVLQTELKTAEEVLVKAAVSDFTALEQKAMKGPASLQNGKVSAVKPELGCVVINLGVSQGVKAGMPFQVRRGTKLIATLRVVDARQGFAGAVIQNLVSDKDPIKLGDTVKADAQLN